jgi:hypothetical protein
MFSSSKSSEPSFHVYANAPWHCLLWAPAINLGVDQVGDHPVEEHSANHGSMSDIEPMPEARSLWSELELRMTHLQQQVEIANPENKQQKLHELDVFVAGVSLEMQQAFAISSSRVQGDLRRAAVARQGGADPDRADYKDTLGKCASTLTIYSYCMHLLSVGADAHNRRNEVAQ